MHEAVCPEEAENDPADDLVNVDVVIEGEEGGSSQVASLGHRVSQDEDEHDY